MDIVINPLCCLGLTHPRWLPWCGNGAGVFRFVRYSKSDLAEMTTPAALLIKDSVAEVDNITLFDRDQMGWDENVDGWVLSKHETCVILT